MIGSLCFANSAPTVTQVTANQRTDGSGIVDIAYNLNVAVGDKCAISVVISNDGGNTWTITPSSGALSPSGALTNVSNGQRTITWNSKLDLPGVFGTNYRIKVTADDGKTLAGMIAIPGGTFQMGDSFSEGYSNERPVHTVMLSSFYMSRYEITNQQYCDFLNSALGQGAVTVTSNVVYKAGSGTSYPYCDTYQSSTYSQINWSGSSFTVRSKSGRSMANDPMVQVSWYGSVAYCNWRSHVEGREQCYNLSTWVCDFSKNGWHLPTEAQWEYAARGGLAGKRFPWGDTISQTQANFFSTTDSYDSSPIKNKYHPIWNDGVYPYTSPVGFFDGSLRYKSDYNWASSLNSYQTFNGGNGYGLYDMSGNVLEWCNDWYGYYSSASQTNPAGPATGTTHVRRGGYWFYGYGGVYFCRVAYRNYEGYPHNRSYYCGFRVSLGF
jgi:formylglycine-generating enzyme required for sulfatase activity